MSAPDRDVLDALRQFLAEAEALSPTGKYMRTNDGRPVALDIWAAKAASAEIEKRLAVALERELP